MSLICYAFACVFAALFSFGVGTNNTRFHFGWFAVALLALGLTLQGIRLW